MTTKEYFESREDESRQYAATIQANIKALTQVIEETDAICNGKKVVTYTINDNVVRIKFAPPTGFWRWCKTKVYKVLVSEKEYDCSEWYCPYVVNADGIDTALGRGASAMLYRMCKAQRIYP